MRLVLHPALEPPGLSDGNSYGTGGGLANQVGKIKMRNTRR